MAGLVYVFIGPTNFVLGLLISEIIAWLSTVKKEDLFMVKKVLIEVISSAKRIKESVSTSWDRHLPSKHSLLMSLCNSSEKGN